MAVGIGGSAKPEDRILSLQDRDAWRKALDQRRPVISHLNADTSWLLQLPRPPSTSASPRKKSKTRQPRERRTYNILIDPWLSGPQTDYAWWISTQWHVIPPLVESMASLNRILAELEDEDAGTDNDGFQECFIDLVLISHEFTDHCHKATLMELPKSTPVVVTDYAAPMIEAWGHFESITLVPHFSEESGDWREALAGLDGALPSWLGVGRVMTKGDGMTGNLHSAVVIAFDLNPRKEERPENPRQMQTRSTSVAAVTKSSSAETTATPSSQGEAIIYTPHGISGSNLTFLSSQANLTTLALLHGLHDVRLGRAMQLNLGAVNGVEAARMCHAKYWIATHDEDKSKSGIVAWFLQRVAYPIGDVVTGDGGDGKDGLKGEDDVQPEFVEVKSGSGLVLV